MPKNYSIKVAIGYGAKLLTVKDGPKELKAFKDRGGVIKLRTFETQREVDAYVLCITDASENGANSIAKIGI
jgi:hypothetical protein